MGRIMSKRTDEPIDCGCIDKLSGSLSDDSEFVNDLMPRPRFRKVCSERMQFSDAAEPIDGKFLDICIWIISIIE